MQFTIEDIDVTTPAFDITPAELIHGIITEKGVAKYPYKESLANCNIMQSTNFKIGIIGGSGMEDPAFISNSNSKEVSTPMVIPVLN